MKTYKQLYSFLLCNQSDALDLLIEGRVIEAIILLQSGMEAAENAYLDTEQDILQDQ